MMTPPATCDSQVRGLTTRPKSCPATICVQRTTPVSVSTSTSAICTPPTPELDTFLFSGLFDSAAVQKPVTLTCSPSRAAQAFFQSQLLPLALSTTLPRSMDKFSALVSSLAAILANSSSRAAVAARCVAGACDGIVVLPPEPLEAPLGLSPNC